LKVILSITTDSPPERRKKGSTPRIQKNTKILRVGTEDTEAKRGAKTRKERKGGKGVGVVCGLKKKKSGNVNSAGRNHIGTQPNQRIGQGGGVP